MKKCRDCLWVVTGYIYRCSHPDAWAGTGRTEEYSGEELAYAGIVRKYGSCKPEAVYFEPKPVPLSFRQRSLRLLSVPVSGVPVIWMALLFVIGWIGSAWLWRVLG